MTKSPGTRVGLSAVAATPGGRFLPAARYRHPGDVIRLIIAGLVLAGALAVTVAAHATYVGASAAAVTAVAPSTLPGRVLAGAVQVLFVVAAVAAVVVTLRYRRFRLLASLAGVAVLAGAVVAGIVQLAGGERPRALTAGGGHWSWLTGASLAGPAVLAAAVAGTVAAAPWLSRPWRRIAWAALWLAAVARLITGTASPVEVVVAFAAGVTVGAGVLVLFGVPDRRIGPDGIAAALASAGLPVARVEPAAVEAKGSRPFFAAAEDGGPLFIKVLGSDQRDADLLYRAYRFIRLRDIGDARPAASLIQAVEHQALAAVMAERAGVAVPPVRQVIKTADGSALLAMERVNGSSLDQIPGQGISDTMLRELWKQVDRLHRARIAHRSLRAANIVVDRAGQPWIVDFSFSELGATQRQMALDVAELLASLAAMIGAGRAVGSAAAVIGPDGVAAGCHPRRRCVPGCRCDRGRRPQPGRPGRYRGGPGRGPDRGRHAGRTRRFRRAAVPAGHLLASRGAGLAVLAHPATAGVHMKPRAVLITACAGLAVTLAACTSSGGHVSPTAGDQAARHGTVISVGSFDFPESVLLAELYGQALAAGKFPVRILANLGTREVVDPALVDGLVQLVPEYAGSALEFFSLGRLSATSNAGAANRALAGSVAGRGLVAARPAPAQDANAIVVSAATAARYGLRSIADLAKVAPGLAFGGPPECPGRAYCLPGLKRVYGLRFKAFTPLDVGGPLTRQALAAGYVGVALLFTTDPGIPARHLVVLADDRLLQPAENITPLVRRDVIARYGPNLLAVLNRVSALLDTGTLRALDARVELAGQNPRMLAGSWLRAHGLIPAGG